MDAKEEKCRGALNRRPAGYWRVFSSWWRNRYAALGQTRPSVNEVIDWYHQNADASWPAGQVPSLKAVLRQSKGLRPIDGLKEYFREYRKKRKQQGGQPLMAGSEAAQRRPRMARRRTHRNAYANSTDDEEEDEVVEVEESMGAEAANSPCHSSDDLEEAEAPARARRPKRSAAAAVVAPALCAAPEPMCPFPNACGRSPSPEIPSSTVTCVMETVSNDSPPVSPSHELGASRPDVRPDDAVAAVQAVFAAWHPGGIEAVAAVAATAAPPPQPPAKWVGRKALRVVDVRTAHRSALPACGAPSTSGYNPMGDAVVPAMSYHSAAPDTPGPVHIGAAPASFAFPPPPPDCQIIRAVPVWRAPRAVAALHGAGAALLPPLSCLLTPGPAASLAPISVPPPFGAPATSYAVPSLLAHGSFVTVKSDAATGSSVPAFAQDSVQGLLACHGMRLQEPHAPRGVQPFDQLSGAPLVRSSSIFASCSSQGAVGTGCEGRRSSSAVPWPAEPAAGPYHKQEAACAPPPLPEAAWDFYGRYLQQLQRPAALPCRNGASSFGAPRAPPTGNPACGEACMLPGGVCAAAVEGGACSSSLSSDCDTGCLDEQRVGQLSSQQHGERPAAPADQEDPQLFLEARPLGMATAGSANSLSSAMPPTTNLPLGTLAGELKGDAFPPSSVLPLGQELGGLCYLGAAGVEGGLGAVGDGCSGTFDDDLAAAWECFVACDATHDATLALGM